MDHLCDLKDLLTFLIKNQFLQGEFSTKEFLEKVRSFDLNQELDKEYLSIKEILEMNERALSLALMHVAFYMNNVRMSTRDNNRFIIMDRRKPLWWV